MTPPRTHHLLERLTDRPAPPLPRRKRYTAPSVRTDGVAGAPLLLCSTGRPYVCEGGGCCDASQYCDYFCNGG